MSIPGLHEVALDALDLHASHDIPQLCFEPARQRLVIGSGNALPTGRIIFSEERALFCDESQYQALLDREPEVDSVVVISASGTKHAPIILEDLQARGFSPYLLTCNAQSPGAALLPTERVVETRSNPEPITYNTSTYIGMILAKTREDPTRIKQHLLDQVKPLIPDFNQYEAFYLLVYPRFEAMLGMFTTKFDELFGGRVNGRCYTTEQTLHAKTVIPWDKELFISFGCRNANFGSERLEIPLPQWAGFAAMMATGYYVIGHIQAQRPPWFKQHAAIYARTQQELFDKH
ncbi:MAG: hypothetical protein GY856_40555 [bacterium]|nr:hypothetical protein [bacterium]